MDMHSDIVLALFWSGIPVVIAIAAYIFFIVGSLAIARSRTLRLEEIVESGGRGATAAQRIVDASGRYLLFTQFGRLLSSISAGFFLAFFTGAVPRAVLGDGVGLWGISWCISIITFCAVIALTLILVQIAKAVSLQYPERSLCAVSVVLTLAYKLFGPILVFAHRAVSRVLSRFDVRISNEREMSVSADDLSEIVKISSENGTLEEEERALIDGVVELSERFTREIMTPRKDIVWVKEQGTTAELLNVLTREGVSRVLVCGRDLDEVRGILLAKDLLPLVGRSLSGVSWQTYLRPAHSVPNTKPVNELLIEFRQRGIHIAVVLDEHGGVDGIVTLEDLVEEIVGDIFDEFDSPLERQHLTREVDGAIFVDGSISIERIKADYGIVLPAGEYETVAGFILAQLRRVPSEGESFVRGSYIFAITEVHRHRIARISIKKVDPVPSLKVEPEQVVAIANSSPSARVRSGG